MNNEIKKGMEFRKTIIEALKYILISSFIIGIVYLFKPQKAVLMNQVIINTMSKTIKIMIGVFLIIGLMQVWLTPKHISKLIGHESGIKGMIIASTVPIFLGGSIITIFPLLKALKDKGVPNRILVTFIVAWAGKMPLLPLEIEFLGIKFAVLRISLIIPLAIILGLMSEKILKNIE